MSETTLYSVIIPVYNVAPYLEEAINSVISQSIGFENIQLILVNDGSTDDSPAICKKYQEQYPDQVVYIEQENKGASAARNAGMEHIRGKYVSFLDGDDKWNSDAFRCAAEMFEAHDEIDVIGARLKYAGTSEKYHKLDYRFDSARIIDIQTDFTCIHLHGAAAFYRASAIRDLRFDDRLIYSEDLKFVNEAIFIKGRYGVLPEAVYHFRKRLDGSGLMQNKGASWYTDVPEYVYEYLCDASVKRFGGVIKYVQFLVLYAYVWRVEKRADKVIHEEALADYFERSHKLLSLVDDDIILTQKDIEYTEIYYLLKSKYGDKFSDHITQEGRWLFFDGTKMYPVNGKEVLKINILDIFKNTMQLAGTVATCLPADSFKFIIALDGAEREIPLLETEKGLRFLDDRSDIRYGFNEKFDIKPDQKFNFYIVYKGDKFALAPSFSFFGKLSSKLPSYTVIGDYSLTLHKKKQLLIRKKNFFRDSYRERKLRSFMKKADPESPVEIRVKYHLEKMKHKKPIWLVSDRTFSANDNGMHMFKYLMKNEKNADVYFVLDKDSPDFEMMQQYGPVIEHGSLKHKIYTLLAQTIISSQMNDSVYNPFGPDMKWFKDLLHFDFVFLQHGITKDDNYNWLNIFDRDIAIFVTAAYREYDAIAHKPLYGYGEERVKLTGMPRFDNLTSQSIKQIAIMPTWRSALSGVFDPATGIRGYNPDFKNSEYCKFYNELMNDPRLLAKMREKGYKGLFVMHPSHMYNCQDIKGNDVFTVFDGVADYQKIFRESDMMISDYSSTPFDFAYMHKPVIYTQFDIDTFFESHSYKKGYFSYEEDGFGPVLYNLEDSVDAVIKLLDNDCRMEQKYIDRVDAFFAFDDTNNCKRVHEAILEKLAER